VKLGNLGGTDASVASARSSDGSLADASQLSIEASKYWVSACQPVSLEASCHNFMAARNTGENCENAPAGRVSITAQSSRPPSSSETASSVSKNAVGGSAETCAFVFDRAFVTHIEHELRTPIATAIGFLEIIKELIQHEHLIDELNEFIDRASVNCDKILSRIDEVISFADLQSDRQDILLHSTRLHDILERSRSIYESDAKQKGLNFKLETLHADRLVHSNADRLLLILNIVVQNAIKFTSHGSVSITTSEFVCGESQDVFIDISVSDTGVGFDAHEHGAIFLPFKQLDGGTSRKFSGLGLGLAIARRTADLMGAVILVESSKLQGSRFTIRVPTERTNASP
jgi:signal transduction histidine kinase